MWLTISAVFGIGLGFVLAWAYSVREAHRRLKKIDPSAQIPLTLIVQRVLSIGLGIVIALATNLYILAHAPTVLNEVAYFACTMGSAVVSWNLFKKLNAQST